MEFLTPKDMAEAIRLKARFPGYKILAGGTDLCVSLNNSPLKPDGIINIGWIKELKEIKETDDNIEIGALATHTEIINNPLIKKFLPALVESCKTIGARQIQNRGTIGGNIMNASPAGDTLPVLLTYDTFVELQGRHGARLVPFNQFYRGYRETVIEKDEILTRFFIKRADMDKRIAFMKIGTRRAQAISKVCGCFRATPSGDFRIALGSVAPIPIRCLKTEGFLSGKKLNKATIDRAVQLIQQEVSPINDIRSTRDYRCHVSGILLKRFLLSASS